MTVKSAIIATTVAAVLLAVALTVSRPGRQQAPPSPPPSASPSAPPSASPSPSSSASGTQPGSPSADQLLPVAPQEITRAAQLARHFVAAYGTYRFDETPDTYLNRLTPMMDGELRRQITKSASAGALLTQRRRDQVISTADARLDGIRDLSAGSIIFLATEIEHLSSGGKHSDQVARYAVTVTNTHSGTGTDFGTGDWAVTAIELASIGDTGDGP